MLNLESLRLRDIKLVAICQPITSHVGQHRSSNMRSLTTTLPISRTYKWLIKAYNTETGTPPVKGFIA